MEPIRLGVIGLGRMGQRHCRVYSNLRRAQLAAVCDVSQPLAEQTGRQYGVAHFVEPEDLLAAVDAVSLVTPTPVHLDMALRCLGRGVHVLIEKPLTETAEQAQRLIQAAETRDLIVMVGHIERFNPAYIELKNVLEGATVLAINVRRLSAYEASNADVDVLLDLMIHDFDLMLNLLGPAPQSVKAFGVSVFERGVDHAVVHLNYPSGPLVSLTASRVTEQKVRSIEVTCLDRYVECDLLNKSIEVHRRTIGEYLNYNHKGVKYRQESIVEKIHVPAFEPLFLELQHFVDCIIEDRVPQIPARDGLRALQLAEAAQLALCCYGQAGDGAEASVPAQPLSLMTHTEGN